MSKKLKVSCHTGIAKIRSTFNNNRITITTLAGDVLCSCSAGECGFKGARKGTPFAAQQAAERACQKAKELFQMKDVRIEIKGAGPGRDSAMRGCGIVMSIKSIKDTTTLPHNGCRRKKKRRV